MDYLRISSRTSVSMGNQNTAFKNSQVVAENRPPRKVPRYVTGKLPHYAKNANSDDDVKCEDFLDRLVPKVEDQDEVSSPVPDEDDPRLRRLACVDRSQSVGERYRRIQEPEVLETVESKRIKLDEPDDTFEDEEVPEIEFERRRKALKQKALEKEANDEEMKNLVDVKAEKSSDSESSEYDEEYTDSEEEGIPRLKPIFIRKGDRAAFIEKEEKANEEKRVEVESKNVVGERRKETLKMVEELLISESSVKADKDYYEGKIEDICTDEEDPEVEHESWKLRELKRNKKDYEERERLEMERQEREKLRSMTEQERLQRLCTSSKTVTNKAIKGKFKFLQRYYHRGAFYLDKEEEILKRDISGATLEDCFNKTVLPKVMKIRDLKNFGRSGRTKYTHLADQDTTQLDSPWVVKSRQNVSSYNKRDGLKQVFERPALKKQ